MVQNVHNNANAHLEKTYGKRQLTIKQVADEVGMAHQGIRNGIPKGIFQIATVKISRNRMVEIEQSTACTDGVSVGEGVQKVPT